MKNRLVFYIPEERQAQLAAFKSIAGVPLFLRGILTAAEAGESHVTLLSPKSHRRTVMRAWKRCARNPHFTLNVITSEEYFSETAVAEIAKTSADQVIFINSNLIFTKELIERLLRGNIQGKYPPTLFALNHQELSRKIILEHVQTSLPRTFPNQDHHHVFLVQSRQEMRPALRFLTENIRLSTMGIFARHLNKRISLPVSVLLSRFRVSPNTITVINMVIGLCAGIGAASITYTGLLVGATLFQLASIIDGCDGEVAKLTFRTTKFGQYIDSISDTFALASFFIGLTIHNIRVNDPGAIWLGILFFSGCIVIYSIMIRFLKRHTQSASLVTYDKEYIQKLPEDIPKWALRIINTGKYAIKKDFFSMMIFLCGLFGLLQYWLYVAAFGVWAGSGMLMYLHYRTRQATRKLSRRIMARSNSSKRLPI